MTKEELAALLDDAEHPLEVSKEIRQQAIESGLVIVYGASDDLMEFDGAISDEVGAPDTVWLDANGLAADFETLCENKDRNGLRDYFKRLDSFSKIESLWCREVDYSWTYKTDIPHATFVIVEDDEPYCRGLVIDLTDLVP